MEPNNRILNTAQDVGARITALPELALRTLQGRVPGQATTPQELGQSLLSIIGRPRGAFGQLDLGGLPSGFQEFNEAMKKDPRNIDLSKFPISPFFMGGVQAVPGASQTAQGGGFIQTTAFKGSQQRAKESADFAKKVVAQELKKVGGVTPSLRKEINILAGAAGKHRSPVENTIFINNLKLTAQRVAKAKSISFNDALIEVMQRAKINPSIMGKISNRINGLGFLADAENAVAAGDTETAKGIFNLIVKLAKLPNSQYKGYESLATSLLKGIGQ